MTNTLINDINNDWKKFDNNQQTTFLKTLGFKVVKKELAACLENDAVSLVDVTAKQLNKIKKTVGFDNWSQKQVKNYDKENGTNYGELLQGISCPTARNTMRSDIIWYSQYKNEAVTVLEERISKDKKTSSLSSLKKHTTAAIKHLEKEVSKATEETTEETTEEAPNTTPETVEDYGIAIAALVLSWQARGYDKGEMIQIAVDVIKSKKK